MEIVFSSNFVSKIVLCPNKMLEQPDADKRKMNYGCTGLFWFELFFEELFKIRIFATNTATATKFGDFS